MLPMNTRVIVGELLKKKLAIAAEVTTTDPEPQNTIWGFVPNLMYNILYMYYYN